ncbi:MAG: flavodoxin family protein [Candidatus Omnitrophica bacterium]|nr:flavodoxin family protein [Candidatus Omnitrophota bacterium]MBU0878117.1 flavodoxin family protein [Candidatus Omnitrophota bacterium]MBU0896965.1 flavodoxin family protein [Candidatus Omnitrophota bacterium]MBU1134506.1 flavodoxin family protein [Candidatus Omnitrophota bacterium]MBU1811162.1 flavodoxin family protein [Candidatus Omnitrophota bacterium]
MKVVVIYYSRGGTTRKIAEIIHQEINSKEVQTDIFSVEDIEASKLLDYDGIIIGSPTYYGTCAAEIKRLLDDSVAFHGKLDGKVGAAFSSAANVAGGNETTVLSILEALLIHGMIIQGDPKGDHYGPVAVGVVDKRCEDNCKRLAVRFVELLNKLKD